MDKDLTNRLTDGEVLFVQALTALVRELNPIEDATSLNSIVNPLTVSYVQWRRKNLPILPTLRVYEGTTNSA